METEEVEVMDTKEEEDVGAGLLGCHPQRGDPVKAARQPTNGHPLITGTAATGRVTSTAAVQPSQFCFLYQFYV